MHVFGHAHGQGTGLSIALSAVLWVATSAPAQTAPPDLSAQFRVPDGLIVTLWAESPQLFNPTALDVDRRGRIWVTEGVNYRKWGGRNPGREHERGDRVMILEDTDGDGVCDSSKVFVQDPDLVSPLGLAVIGRQVFVSCSPNLFVYEDLDGDDVADQRLTLLSGFGGADHDHGLHSVTEGVDGALTFNVGNAGPHLVTDRAGWNLRSGSIYTGGGAELAPNRPGLVSDDGRIWTGGLVLRVQPDGRGLSVLAHNFRNPYEVAQDAFGNLFQSDNDDDGNGSCRTLWVMPGGNYGFFSPDGSRTWQADRRPGQNLQRAHWHQDDPGVAPMGCINGGGGPTGVAVYEGGLLPESFLGAVLNCDAGRSVVYSHRARPEGAGFVLEPGELLSARPGERSSWFRPSDVLVGGEGAIYVADWHDPGVGGHGAGDREAYGRILRIAPKGAPTRARPIRVETERQALAALDNPAVHIRALGRRWLVQNQSAAALRERLKTGDARSRARAVWILAALEDTESVRTLLRDPDPNLRLSALRSTPTLARELVDDPSPAVRREVAFRVRDLPEAERLPLLESLALHRPVPDRTYLEALGAGAQGVEEALFVRLLEGQDPDPRRWTAGFSELVWRLHPQACVPALLTRIMASELSLEARREALNTLAFIDSLRAAEGMAAAAEGGPDDMRDEAYWWLMHRDANDWARFGLSAQLGGDRRTARELFRSGPMASGTRTIDVALQGSTTVWLVVDELQDGPACDWADWIDPRLTGSAGERSLLEHGWVHAKVGWGQLGRNRNAVGDPLSIDGRIFERGLGVHAPSEIMLRIPEGYDRFRAGIGPDDGGSKQSGCETSVEFKLLGAVPVRSAKDPRLTELLAVLQDPAGLPAVREQAAAELTGSPDGGALLVSLAAGGKLDEQAQALVAGTIFRSPDETVRALASRYFDRPGRSGARLPPISELARLRGRADRGQAVFLDPRAGCVACHRMRGPGGDLGPELTRIRTKFDRVGLLDAILNPNAAIAFGYEPWLIELNDGQLHHGYLLADGERLVLKNMSGQRVTIEAGQVRARTRQATSLMPDGVALGLNSQELADLTAFLLADPFEDLALGEPVELFNGQDLTGWTEIECAGIWTAQAGRLHCPGQPIGYLRTEQEYTNFVLTLEWRTPTGNPPGNSGVLLRMTGKDQVWPDSIEAQLQSGHAGDIWNIGQFPMQVARERTEGRRTQKSHPSNEQPLGRWNRYEIILHHGDLRLSVNGLVQNQASFCEERAGKLGLQSEGAAIEFRNIVLRPILE